MHKTFKNKKVKKYIKNNKPYKSSVNPKSYELNVTNWVNGDIENIVKFA